MSGLKNRLILDASGAFLLISLLAVAPVLLPINASLPTNQAEDYLRTLWQVQAATVALVITIVLFVFSVFSSRSRSSVHNFAEDTGLFPVFFIGVWAIALDGLVLVGFGWGGPNDWPGLLIQQLRFRRAPGPTGP